MKRVAILLLLLGGCVRTVSLDPKADAAPANLFHPDAAVDADLSISIDAPPADASLIDGPPADAAPDAS